ncbi:Uncharacterised protein [Vibrio cholerae]|nr:Uncharacterised protein [Vibrio cholerae]
MMQCGWRVSIWKTILNAMYAKYFLMRIGTILNPNIWRLLMLNVSLQKMKRQRRCLACRLLS